MLKKSKKERLVWIDIMITLLALELMSYFYYGTRALLLGGLCILVSFLAELFSLRLMHKRFTADNLSCTSDGLIIALMMPVSIEYKLPAIACVFALTVAKNLFGGKSNMIFSPAAVAYLFMLTSWSSKLLMYPNTYTKMSVFENNDELVRSASHILNTTGKMSASDFEILLGNFSGPMGAVSILLLIVSAFILIFRKDISAGAFIGTIIGTAFMAYFCPIVTSSIDSVKYVFATNMIMFAAIYIISDLRIAPKKNYYAFFYGFFISVSSYVIMLTTGKENVIVIMSVLFTPAALAFKNLEKKIEKAENFSANKELSLNKFAADEIFAESDTIGVSENVLMDIERENEEVAVQESPEGDDSIV